MLLSIHTDTWRYSLLVTHTYRPTASAGPLKRSVITRSYYTGWAKKTGLFFRLDNFVTVSPRKACSMSKFSQFYREKGTELAFQ